MQNKRGKRGSGHSKRRSFQPNKNKFFNATGHDDRPGAVRTSQPVKPSTGNSSSTAAVHNAAIYIEGSFVGETAETHLVPRKSLTDQQMLRLLPQQAEYEDRVSRQLDKVTGKLVTVTDRRRVWQSDRTLLKRGNPFAGDNIFKREGAIKEGQNTRKYVEVLHEVPFEVPEGTELSAEVDLPGEKL